MTPIWNRRTNAFAVTNNSAIATRAGAVADTVNTPGPRIAAQTFLAVDTDGAVGQTGWEHQCVDGLYRGTIQ